MYWFQSSVYKSQIITVTGIFHSSSNTAWYRRCRINTTWYQQPQTNEHKYKQYSYVNHFTLHCRNRAVRISTFSEDCNKRQVISLSTRNEGAAQVYIVLCCVRNLLVSPLTNYAVLISFPSMAKTRHEMFTDQRVHFLQFKGQFLTFRNRAQVTHRFVQYAQSIGQRTCASNTGVRARRKFTATVYPSVRPSLTLFTSKTKNDEEKL